MLRGNEDPFGNWAAFLDIFNSKFFFHENVRSKCETLDHYKTIPFYELFEYLKFNFINK